MKVRMSMLSLIHKARRGTLVCSNILTHDLASDVDVALTCRYLLYCRLSISSELRLQSKGRVLLLLNTHVFAKSKIYVIFPFPFLPSAPPWTDITCSNENVPDLYDNTR